ncbi:hypothetical protein [Actinomadura sp. 9N407]|uniref:hypothetical protein n=1 Tax=Actinomadura sp. 9N407 TaxID=3375154 RepID=UPI00379E5D21
MRVHLRRFLVSAVVALMALAVWPGAPARAQVDMELVAESIGEAGYYVDSGAGYFKSDKALDLLRDTKDRRVPVFVAVLPKGVAADKAATQLMAAVGRKGTYAVLAGDTLQVRSNTLPPATVTSTLKKATAANAGRPDKALVDFVSQLPKAQQMPPKDPRTVKKPLNETKVGEDRSAAEQEAADSPKTPAAATRKDDGGFPIGLLIGVLGALAVLVAVGAFLILRRRGKATPAPVGAPGGAAGGVPGGAPGAGGLPAGPGAVGGGAQSTPPPGHDQRGGSAADQQGPPGGQH